MNEAVIYSPSKTSMQSGTAKTGYWILEFKNEKLKVNDPLMGWIGGAETQSQISLKFETLDEAVNYANQNNLSYIVRKPKPRKLRIKSYSENYAFNRKESWTH